MLGALRQRSSGLTLVELLVTIIVAGVLLTIALPSLRGFILLQRLKSINSQIVTDLQYARAEAAARNEFVHMRFLSNAGLSCYVIYTTSEDLATRAARCDCRTSETSTCAAGANAIRTQRMPAADSVKLRTPAEQVTVFAFDHVSGGIRSVASDLFGVPIERFVVEAYLTTDSTLTLRNAVAESGRVAVCAPSGLAVGAAAC
jgi:type IV fimbrial biogenesis protein FimT